jgi:hypothetical protein
LAAVQLDGCLCQTKSHTVTEVVGVFVRFFVRRFMDICLNNYDSLNPINFKYTSDYLGFTENHFWSMTQLTNNTNAELHYYLETARPITNLVELYIVDLETGKITKEISGDGIAYKDRSHPNRRSLLI